MSSTEPHQPDAVSAAISAALDELIGPAPDEVVQEQAQKPARPPLDSGIEEEQARFNRYWA